MRLDESCKVQCKLRLTASQARDFQERIDDEYRITMCALVCTCLHLCAGVGVHSSAPPDALSRARRRILDNLPTAQARQASGPSCSLCFPALHATHAVSGGAARMVLPMASPWIAQ
jgi:hypothetical protein